MSDPLTFAEWVGAVFPPPAKTIQPETYGPLGNDIVGNYLEVSPADVALTVQFGANGTQYTGTLVVTGGGGDPDDIAAAVWALAVTLGLVENVGGNRFTAKALETAPSTISAGQYRLTITTTDDGDALAGVRLQIVGVAGTSRTTTTAGPSTIDLDAGSYTLRVTPPQGFAPVADIAIDDLDANLSIPIALVRTTIDPPAAGNICRVTLRVADESDSPWVAMPVFATLVSGPGVGSTLHANRGEPVLTDADGIATLDRLQGQVYDITAQRPDGVEVTIRRQLPAAANANLSTLTVPS
jgi:hypothetical protein